MLPTMPLHVVYVVIRLADGWVSHVSVNERTARMSCAITCIHILQFQTLKQTHQCSLLCLQPDIVHDGLQRQGDSAIDSTTVTAFQPAVKIHPKCINQARCLTAARHRSLLLLCDNHRTDIRHLSSQDHEP